VQGDGTNESLRQAAERVIAGNVKGLNVPESEQKELLRLLMENKAGPAGRGWWFSGAEAQDKIGGAALNNCWYLNAAEWQNYIIAQDLLMLGGGVGLSVEHRFVSKLPKIKKGVVIVHKLTKDADFIVPDSREGWNELIYRVLESYFVTGKGFTYSTICVRGAGEAIVGFGGVSSGPLDLTKLVATLGTILNPRGGKSVRPLDAADIICAIGEMVVSGNVRRSAILILGDAWDKDYLKAKRWDLGVLPSYRGKANFSVVCDDIDDVHPLFWKTYEEGEPFGILNRSNIQKYGRMGELKADKAEGANPCQPAWATVLTPEGIRQFKDIDAGSTIWSGSKWTKVVKKWSTGQKPVRAFATRAGTFYGTGNHKVVSNGAKVEAYDAVTIDTVQGPSRFSLNRYAMDVMDGLVIGDGTVHEASGNLVGLDIGVNDGDYHTSEIRTLIGRARPGVSEHFWEITTTVTHDELPRTFLREVPERFKQGDEATVCGFLRGLFSANGSIAGGRVTLKQSSFKMIEDVQQMLSGIGIRSYYTCNKGKAVKFSNGTYQCKDSFDLNILTDRVAFAERIGFLQGYKNAALAKAIASGQQIEKKTPKSSYEVKEVTSLGVQEVFDIMVEDEAHTYWTGGLLVSNCVEATLEHGEPCNLTEQALCNLNGPQEFFGASRLMHRWAKRVTMARYHHKVSADVVARNRRTGAGITGILNSPLYTPDILDEAYKQIQMEDIAYSAQLGVPLSVRTTVVKPSGTRSKVMDCGGYEGAHAPLSRYMIQRIRFAASDSLVPLLRAAGHHVEFDIKLDGKRDHSTVVAEFYVAAPVGYPVVDEGWDTWKQLDTLKLLQKHWADQAVSVTVYYKKEEIPQIRAWLADNLQYIKSISFLLETGHGFKLAPKEAITREEYDRLSKNIKPIALDDISDGEMESQECAGGLCPIK